MTDQQTDTPDVVVDDVTYSLITDAQGVLVAAVKSNTAQTAMPNQTVSSVDADIYAQARIAVGRMLWDGKSLVPYTPLVPPTPVPYSVTRLQGRLALSRAGLLSKAEASVASTGGETEIWYEDAQVWRRDDPHVSAIAQSLGLSSDDTDKLFTAASLL